MFKVSCGKGTSVLLKVIGETIHHQSIFDIVLKILANAIRKKKVTRDVKFQTIR